MYIELLFWIPVGLVAWVYLGYPVALGLLHHLWRPNTPIVFLEESDLPMVSVIIAAHNEESVIEARIRNTLAQDYPREMLEVIVASDGSTDRTVEVVRQYADPRVRVLDFKEHRGRSSVHNGAVKDSKGDILIFTDADTSFEEGFLRRCVPPFATEGIGCVVGKLVLRTSSSSVSEAEGLYWRYELKIREWESALGILANGTGACMAIRRELFLPLKPVDDVDTTSVLDILQMGYRAILITDAIAYDVPPISVGAELRARTRMTAQTFETILRKWTVRNWLPKRGITFGLLSHRMLRYLSPYFFITAFIANVLLLDKGLFYQIAFIGQITFYATAVTGWLLEFRSVTLPLVSTVFSFCVANVGMLVGVAIAVTGRAPAKYEMPRESTRS